MQTLSAPAQALLGSDALAHVVTNNPDGTAQVSVVWCGVVGDEVYFCTEGDTQKVRNLRADPRIVLSIEDEERNRRGLQQHLIIRGRATISDGPDAVLTDQLCRAYLGTADHPLNLRNSPTAVVVRVEIDHIGGAGPWVEGG